MSRNSRAGLVQRQHVSLPSKNTGTQGPPGPPGPAGSSAAATSVVHHDWLPAGVTNRNTAVTVNEVSGPDKMAYKGDFCCGTYATVLVDTDPTTTTHDQTAAMGLFNPNLSKNPQFQAGEVMTIKYKTAVGNGSGQYNSTDVASSITQPYQTYDHTPYEASETRPPDSLLSPDTTSQTVVPHLQYVQSPTGTYSFEITLWDAHPMGVTLSDPFEVDPDNVDGNAGMYAMHIALSGFVLVKDKRGYSQGDLTSYSYPMGPMPGAPNVAAFYRPGRPVGLDGFVDHDPGGVRVGQGGQHQAYAANALGVDNNNDDKPDKVHCTVSIALYEKNADAYSYTRVTQGSIGTFHRVVAWKAGSKNDGARAGFPGDSTGYAGTDILLIRLGGQIMDTGKSF